MHDISGWRGATLSMAIARAGLLLRQFLRLSACVLTFAVVALAQTPPAIPKTGWTLVYVDSQQATVGSATRAFDGDPTTGWHTEYSPTLALLPHEIQIDLGAFYDLSSFSYLPRQDNCSNGWIKNYEFYVSTDPTKWGTPVASGVFDYTGAIFGCPGASVPPASTISFTTVTGRYIRLRALSEVTGQQYTSAAEIGVVGVPHTGNIPPSATITSPTANLTISTGQSVTFAGSGTDPDGDLPLTYHWDFGTSGIAPSNQQNPGAVIFNTAGTFTVTFTVTDSLGATGTATRTITVQNGSVPMAISKTGWTLVYVDSQQATVGSATRAFDGDPTTAWHTEYSPTLALLPHEIQIDLGAFYDLSSFSYLPRQDNCSNGWIKNYEFYVITAPTKWGTPVASGVFDYTGAIFGCPGASVPPASTISFTTVTGRYIRLRALSEVTGQQYTSAAEIGVVGVPHTGNIPPSATITSPTANLTISTGQSVTFAGSGTDPDGDLPLTYHWDFGTSGIAPSNQQNPGAVIFNTAGTFTVTFTVIDSLGATGTATRTITVANGSVPMAISKTGWTLVYVDSQQATVGSATRAFDGDPTTGWHTEYSPTLALLPHEIQIDLGAFYDLSSFSYLPRQDNCSNGWIKNYEFYVSTDPTKWGTPVASGAFDYTGAIFGCPGASVPPASTISFTTVTGRYIRLRALSEVTGQQYTSAAEIGVV